LQPQPTLRRNLERKVRCADLANLPPRLGRLGATLEGVQEQTDIYFHARHGRLKLRVIPGRPAVLIWYQRPDAAADRLSSYYLVPVTDAGLTRAALAAALGARGEVRKRRTVHHWHNVRIHLDEVDGLGTFVEFEAVLGEGDDEATAQGRLDHLGRELGLEGAEVLAGSYAELLGF
jgi:predicted adenylyl cyclase CyaB